MQNTPQKLILTMVAVILAAILFYWAPYIGQNMGSKESRIVKPKAEKIAEIKSLKDEAVISSVNEGAKVVTVKSELPVPVYNWQTVTTGIASQVVLAFANGYELKLLPMSQALLEYWNPKDPRSPVYLTLQSGRLKVLKKGPVGSLFVVHENELFLPGNMKTEKVRELVISQSASYETPVSFQDLTPPKKAGSTGPSQSQKTLSNAYMNEVIEARRKQFQRCQVNALQEGGPTNGKILVGLTVNPRGTMSEVRILNTEIENDQLLKCVAGVFQRVRFRPFSGPDIVRSYPLVFE